MVSVSGAKYLDINYNMIFYLLSIIEIWVFIYICVALYRYPNYGKNKIIPFLIVFIIMFYIQNHYFYIRKKEKFDSRGIANDIRQINATDAAWNLQFPFIKTHIDYINQQLVGIKDNTKWMQYTTI
jgi:hypothetical protein